MANSNPITAAPAMVDRDTFCMDCGYNLRGLAADGRCPECGGVIAKSLTPHTFANADRCWLRRLRAGVWLLIGSSLIGAATGLVCVHAFPLFMSGLMSNPTALKLHLALEMTLDLPSHWDEPAAFVEVTLTLISAILIPMAAWMLTSRWPWPAIEPTRLRRWLRVVSCISVVVVVGMAILSWAYAKFGLWHFWWYARGSAETLLYALDLLQALLLMRFLACLGRCGDDRRLPRLLATLGWLVIPLSAAFYLVNVWSIKAALPLISVLPVHSTVSLWALYRLQNTMRTGPDWPWIGHTVNSSIMICIVQRVSEAQVHVEGEIVGKIDRGMLVLAAVEKGDTSAEAEWTAAKLAGLRIFPNPADAEKEFDQDVKQIGGQMLLVSNFTVAAATRKGKRPSFDAAAAPADAERIFDDLVRAVRSLDIPVETGRFRAMMQVSLANDGPATFIVERRPETVERSQ